MASAKNDWPKGWGELPFSVLERVLKHLSWKERSSTSTVCKNWSRAFSSPFLWESPVFRFPGTAYAAKKYAGKKFVERYGRHFRHLKVKYLRPTFRGIYHMQVALCKFLKLLVSKRIKVETLELKKLVAYQSWRNCMRSKFMSRFLRFLQSQDRLKHLDLRQAEVLRSEGLRILRLLAKKSGPSINKLYLTDFFRTRIPITNIRTYSNLFGHFCNLQILAIDYSVLSDHFLDSLASNVGENLREMKVTLRAKSPRDRTLSGERWINLKEARPLLHVDFEINSFHTWNEHLRILPMGIPLRCFSYTASPIRSLYRHDLEKLCKHVAETYPQTLEKVKLKMRFMVLRLSEALGALYPGCSVLKRIDVIGSLAVPNLEEVLEQWVKERPPLEIFRMSMVDRGSLPERYYYTSLYKKFTPQFREIGIDAAFSLVEKRKR